MANSMSDQVVRLQCQKFFLSVSKIKLSCNKVGCFVSCWKLILSQRQWGADLVSFTFCMFFCRLLIFFSNSFFSISSLRNVIRKSDILDPYQAQRFVGPDLDPNCLPRLSADDTSRQRVNS